MVPCLQHPLHLRSIKQGILFNTMTLFPQIYTGRPRRDRPLHRLLVSLKKLCVSISPQHDRPPASIQINEINVHATQDSHRQSIRQQCRLNQRICFAVGASIHFEVQPWYIPKPSCFHFPHQGFEIRRFKTNCYFRIHPEQGTSSFVQKLGNKKAQIQLMIVSCPSPACNISWPEVGHPPESNNGFQPSFAQCIPCGNFWCSVSMRNVARSALWFDPRSSKSVAPDLDKPSDLEEVMKSIRRCMPMELQKSPRVH